MFAGSMGRKHKVKTKNLLRAVVATLVAGAMGLAGVGSAMADTTRVSADDLTKNQTLTVTANEDISGRSLKAVPLAYYSFAQTDGKGITGFDLIDAGHASSIATALTDAKIDTSKKAQTTGYDYNASNPMVWVVQNLLDSDQSPYAGRLRDFIDKLKNDATVTGDKNATAFEKAADNKKVQTASVRPGVYAVVDTTTTGRASIVMFNGTGINGITSLKNGSKTYTLGSVDYKISDVTVSKKAVDVTDKGTHAHISENGHTVDSHLGSTIDFEMDTTVPNWTGYDKFYFAVNDTYTPGLYIDTVDANGNSNPTAGFAVTVTPKGGKATTLTQGTDYKVVLDNAKHEFHVVFLDGKTNQANQTEDIIPNTAKLPVGAAVKITYRMITVGDNGGSKPGTADTNTNNVEYSHNPNTWTDHETKDGETVKVYTGSTKILKVDSNGTPLANAEFKVYKDGKEIKLSKDGNDNNAYRIAVNRDGKDEQPQNDANTIVSDNNGYIIINGLDGEYTIKETKSPFGNVSILPEWKVNVTVSQADGKYTTTVTPDNNKLVSALDQQAGSKVINARNIMDMPKTGAVWLSIFGAMTVLLAGASFLLLRRKA